jgi:anaphase-promoting complex subunit 2
VRLSVASWSQFEIDVDRSDVWTLDELIKCLGSVDRTAALKALLTWVDMGVLKEDTDKSFRLLEIAEECAPNAHASLSRPGADSCLFCISHPELNCSGCSAPILEELPSVSVAQQQQAEQMKVYWKVNWLLFPFTNEEH